MNTELMEAFDFTAEDLASNELNRLSPRQAQRFAKNRKRDIVVLIIFMLGFAAVAVFLLLPFIRQEQSISSNLGRFIFGVVLAILSLLIFLVLLKREEPVVKSVQGKAQFVQKEIPGVEDRSGYTEYSVVIGEHKFAIEMDKYEAFNQGHIYTVL